MEKDVRKSAPGPKVLFSRMRARIVLVTLFALVPAFALILKSAKDRREKDLASVQRGTLWLAKSIASNMERDIAGTKALLISLSEAPGRGTMDREESLIRKIGGESNQYANIGVADSDGNVVSSLVPLSRGEHIGEYGWFKEAWNKKGFAGGYDYKGKLGAKASLCFGYPMRDAEGKAERIGFAVLNLDWLGQFAAHSEFPATGTITVTDQNGVTLSRFPNPEKWVGKSTGDLAPEARKNLPREGLVEGPGVDGVLRIYAFATVGERFLTVKIGMAPEDVYGPANRDRMASLLGLGAVALFALLAGWFGADIFLVNQVKSLLTATRAIAAGNLNARTNLDYDLGELGELAKTFDEMAETLEWRNAQLKETENEIREIHTEFQKVVNEIPVATFLCDTKLDLTFMNREAVRLFRAVGIDFRGSLFEIFPEAGMPLRASQEGLKQGADVPGYTGDATGIGFDGIRIKGYMKTATTKVDGKVIVMATFQPQSEHSLA